MTCVVCSQRIEEGRRKGLPPREAKYCVKCRAERRRRARLKYVWKPEYDAYLKGHYFGGLKHRFLVLSHMGSDDRPATVVHQAPSRAAGSYDAQDLVLKPRQVFAFTVELALRATQKTRIEVWAYTSDLDTAKTSTSRVLTRQALEALPSPLTRDVPTLVENLAQGAILSHDNFIHLRGNELSLNQFINGVSFLDNPHQQFTPGLSPEVFETVNIITGGFPAEFGNRFGGVLDVTTRSGRTLNGHGSATLGFGTVLHNDAAVDFGGSAGRWGYYIYAGGFESRRFLNPPVRDELHDTGKGLRGTFQLDYQGDKDIWKLLLIGGGTNFKLPNTPDDEVGE